MLLSRNLYSSDTGIAASIAAQHTDLLVTQENLYTQDALPQRAANPGAKVWMYTNAMWVRENDTPGTLTPVTFSVADPNETWFLHTTATGNPRAITGTSPNRQFYMNVANAAYQAACITHITSIFTAQGPNSFDGIFIDGVASNLVAGFGDFPSGSPCLEYAGGFTAYPTDWHTAMLAWLAAVIPALKANGIPVCVINTDLSEEWLINSSDATQGSSWWNAALAQVDGAMEESWCDGGAGPAQNITTNGGHAFPCHLADAAYTGAQGKYFLGHSARSLTNPVQTDEVAATYALGMTLLAVNDDPASSANKVTVGLNGPSVNQTNVPWYPEYASALLLGKPAGAFIKNTDGTYLRYFAKGTVLVNPTANAQRGLQPFTASITLSPSGLQIGRLVLGSPTAAITEQLGDPVTSLGGSVVPGQRQALQTQMSLATNLGAGTTVAQAQTLRRQLRSMLANSPLKLGGFLYVQYADDTEQNGWYIPDQTTLAAYDKASWKAIGLWQTEQGNWLLAGRKRTHREARQVALKDLRTGLYARDTLGLIYSTDFGALIALAITTLPNGATYVSDAVSGARPSLLACPAGRDGGQNLMIAGHTTDLQTLSFERPTLAMGPGDVIAYDRRGTLTAPTTGPDPSWEEVYGADYPWNWVNNGTADTPVLDNGLVRLRWDPTNTPGFRVDYWNGGSYVEQGKMLLYRNGDTPAFCDTWVSAGLHTDGGYTPDRAIASVVLASSSDLLSHEQVFITMQRGLTEVTFEAYGAPKSSGALPDMQLVWCPALTSGVADANVSVFKSDTQTSPAPIGTGKIAPTAGSGSVLLPSAALGNATYATSENFAAILRCPATYNVVAPTTAPQVSIAVLQGAAAALFTGSGSNAYGVSQSIILIESQGGAGYVQAQLAFAATVTDQVQEAESIRNSASSSVISDATASGGSAVQETASAEAATTLKSVTNLLQAKYRCFARVKVDSGATGSFRFRSAAHNGTVVTSTSTSWVWLDLGDLGIDAGANLQVTSWRSAGGAGNVYIDRFELFIVEDVQRGGIGFMAARDTGQRALYDSRTLGALVAR